MIVLCLCGKVCIKTALRVLNILTAWDLQPLSASSDPNFNVHSYPFFVAISDKIQFVEFSITCFVFYITICANGNVNNRMLY